MSLLVSVVMPVYNQEKYLAETIEGVLNQSFCDFEFLVVDDGSTDGSAEIIREYAARDKRIIPFFRNNAGKCVATNNLVTIAKGKYCAFLDADDVMLPDRLELQVAFHLAKPEIDASSGHCYYINERSHLLGKQYYPGLRTPDECRKVQESKLLINCAFTALMVARKAFLELGGLRSEYAPCEDFDFVNRLIEKQYILVIMQNTLMKYRIHASAVTVRQPMHMFDKIGWVYYNSTLRRSGQSEISFESFVRIIKEEHRWKRLNRKMFHYSMLYFRRAGFSLMSKKYLLFLKQITLALLFSPKYVFVKLVRIKVV